MNWDAHKEHKETAAHLRERMAFVLGDMSQQKMTVGKHEAMNWVSLKSVYEEALEKCPRAAHTIAWMLWHDIIHADRFAALTEPEAAKED
jgi:hypothetical protein